MERSSRYTTTIQCKHRLHFNVAEGEAVKMVEYRKLSNVPFLKVTEKSNTQDYKLVATHFSITDTII